MRLALHYHSSCILLLACACMGSLPAGAEDAPVTPIAPTPPTASASTIDRLIAELASPDYDKRRAAEVKLEKQGEGARAAIEQAARAPDPEVREAAERLLAKLRLATIVFYAGDREGRPAAGAQGEVVLNEYQASGNSGALPFRLDAQGALRIPNRERAYSTFRFKFDSSVSPYSAYALCLHSGINPQVLYLVEGATLSAKVVDMEGQPVPKASVKLFGDYVDPEMQRLQSLWPELANGGLVIEPQSAVADAQGRCHFEHLCNGVYYLAAGGEGFITTSSGPLRVREEAPVDGGVLVLERLQRGKLELKLETMEAGKPFKRRNILVGLKPFFDGPRAAERQRVYTQLLQATASEGNATLLQAATDDQGSFKLDSIPSGAYALKIYPNTDDPIAPGGDEATEQDNEQAQFVYECPRIEVKPGATTALTLHPIKTGKLQGSVRGAKGADGIGVTLFREERLRKLIAAGVNPLDMEDTNVPGIKRSAVGEDESYEISDVPPGRYAALVSNQLHNAGDTVWLMALEVKPGETTVAPDAAWEPAASARKVSIAGKVLNADHKPLPGAQVCFNGNTYFNAGADGAFDFSSTLNLPESLPLRLYVHTAGYKPNHMEIAAFEAQNLQVVLTRQRYGSVRAAVVDEAGQPISGAAVYVNKSAFVGPNVHPVVPRRTDANGCVVLPHIAEGPRWLAATAKGYYLQKACQIGVRSEQTVEARIVMSKALRVEGSVETPPGFDGPVQMEIVSGPLWTPISVLAQDGKFAYDDLIPGEYRLNATAWGLRMSEPVGFSVAPGNTPHPVVKLARGAALAIATTPAPGLKLMLADPVRWNAPDSEDEFDPYREYADADASGRAEFWNIMPGEYAVVCKPVPGSDTASRIHAMLLLGKVRASQGVPARQMASLPAINLTHPKPVGSIVYRPVIDNGQEIAKLRLEHGAYPTFSIVLQGEKAVSRLGLDWEKLARKQRIIGAPPPEMETPGTFAFVGLPDGRYTLFCVTRFYCNGSYRDSKPQAKPLASVSIKNGGAEDLGSLRLQIQAPAGVLALPPEDPFGDEVEAQPFQP